MGWDDSPEAHYTAPPLTSVAHDMGELARRAIEAIERRQQDGAAMPLRLVVPHHLVPRASTGG
jgi:DNA-binding LacI/PurR family transcriptional regulator